MRRTVNPVGVNRTTERPDIPDAGDPSPAAGVVTNTTAITRNATVREYDDDNLLTAVHLPVDNTAGLSDPRRFRQNFKRDLRGRVMWIDSPYDWAPGVPQKTVRTSYTHYANGWVKSVSDQRSATPSSDDGVTDIMFDYRFDRRGNQTQWSTSGRRVDRLFFPNSLLRQRRAVKTADQSQRVYDYLYNPTRSLIQILDHQEPRQTNMAYDDSERRTIVNEARTNGHDTALDYDHDGNLTRLRVDGRITAVGTGGIVSSYVGGKSTSFDFDSLGRETRAEVTASPNRVTRTEFWPFSDLVRSRTKSNGVEERFEYLNDGRTSRMQRFAPGGSQTKDQGYEYDRNGNRTRDERGQFAFNGRDQLAVWSRPADGSLVFYEHNGSGALTRRSDGHAPPDYTVFCYQDAAGANTGDRLAFSKKSLSSSISCGNTVTAERTDYEYDQFGSVKTIDPPGTEPSLLLAYDEFERLSPYAAV